MLEVEFKYYLDNQEELIKKYNEKFIIIVGKEVVGSFDTQEQGYKEGLKKYKEGGFLLQQCKPGGEGYNQTFHSRVIFDKSAK